MDRQNDDHFSISLIQEINEIQMAPLVVSPGRPALISNNILKETFSSLKIDFVDLKHQVEELQSNDSFADSSLFQARGGLPHIRMIGMIAVFLRG